MGFLLTFALLYTICQAAYTVEVNWYGDPCNWSVVDALVLHPSECTPNLESCAANTTVCVESPASLPFAHRALALFKDGASGCAEADVRFYTVQVLDRCLVSPGDMSSMNTCNSTHLVSYYWNTMATCDFGADSATYLTTVDALDTCHNTYQYICTTSL